MSFEFQNWTKEIDANGIAWLGLDCHNCSANVINNEVLDELNIILQKIAKDEAIKGIVFFSKKTSGFIAGADVHSFSQLHEPEQVRDFLKKGLNFLNYENKELSVFFNINHVFS